MGGCRGQQIATVGVSFQHPLTKFNLSRASRMTPSIAQPTITAIGTRHTLRMRYMHITASPTPGRRELRGLPALQINCSFAH